jgi:hypothetical protein
MSRSDRYCGALEMRLEIRDKVKGNVSNRNMIMIRVKHAIEVKMLSLDSLLVISSVLVLEYKIQISAKANL